MTKTISSTLAKYLQRLEKIRSHIKIEENKAIKVIKQIEKKHLLTGTDEYFARQIIEDNGFNELLSDGWKINRS